MNASTRIVVTGAGGQVGRALRQLLPHASFYSHSALDVTDSAAVSASIRGASVVLHCAALTNVDGCEAEPECAHEVNARGTRNVIEAAAKTGARVIYVSTDYVFDGLKGSEYEVDDEPGPVNEYGRSKLDGERYAAGDSGNLILRTSSVFGDGRNFVRTIIAAARAGKDLRIVDDQISRPSAAADVARAIAHLVETTTAGVLHVAGDGPACSWAELAEHALEAARVAAPVARVESSSYAASAGRVIAPRPPNSSLSLDAARDLGVPLADWRDSLGRYVQENRL